MFRYFFNVKVKAIGGYVYAGCLPVCQFKVYFSWLGGAYLYYVRFLWFEVGISALLFREPFFDFKSGRIGFFGLTNFRYFCSAAT